MNQVKISTQRILSEIATKFPGQTDFRRAIIEDVAKSMGFTAKDFYPLLTPENRVKIGTYSLDGLLPEAAPAATVDQVPATAAQMQSITSDEKTYARVDPTFVPWGSFKDVTQIIKSEMFYPTYVSGLSGNGKTFMIEQACAKLGKEFIRVQINPETDEDDLIGGFRLINGETVFAKGPVLKAMESGAILLLDEIDRATNKIMCLQGILEGKPVLVKKTGETISPAKGFNVFATANTKGKGSDDGRFTAASILDDAFLERFTISIDMQFPGLAIEKKILSKHMVKFDVEDIEFVTKLVTWADIIRKTFYDDGVDEVISTRRLCHIVQTFSIFNDRMKSIDLCVSRFDEDTKIAFLDLYTKVDSGAQLDYGQPDVSEETPEEEYDY
jgi:hypothetical protein|tara:strand:- start:465 stop:1619 length:1155 start_codon:yes stop_codon:yes gene_type:complete